jgi:hypothetical protein
MEQEDGKILGLDVPEADVAARWQPRELSLDGYQARAAPTQAAGNLPVFPTSCEILNLQGSYRGVPGI